MSNRIMTGVEVNILCHVLDDDADTLFIIEQILKANNITDYKTHLQPDEFLASLNADIIVALLDYNLNHGMTGIDVLKAIKRKNKGSFVIVLSGTKNYRDVISCVNTGADRYLDKNDENYMEFLVDYLQEGLNEAKKRWGLMYFLQNQKERSK